MKDNDWESLRQKRALVWNMTKSTDVLKQYDSGSSLKFNLDITPV